MTKQYRVRDIRYNIEIKKNKLHTLRFGKSVDV